MSEYICSLELMQIFISQSYVLGLYCVVEIANEFFNGDIFSPSNTRRGPDYKLPAPFHASAMDKNVTPANPQSL